MFETDEHVPEKARPSGSFKRTLVWCSFLIACGVVVAGRSGLIPFDLRIAGDLLGLAAVFSLMFFFWRKEQQQSVNDERVSDPKAVQLIATIESDLRKESDGPAD